MKAVPAFVLRPAPVCSQWASTKVASNPRSTAVRASPETVRPPRPALGPGPGDPDGSEPTRIDRIDDPRSRGRRRNGTKEARLARSTHRSDRQSPPSAKVSATSSRTRPGSWRRLRCTVGARASLRAPVRPVKSAISASSRVPACEAMPLPSAVTDNGGRGWYASLWKCPSLGGCLMLRNTKFPRDEGLFRVIGPCSRRLHETCGLMVVAPVVVDIDGPAQLGTAHP